MAALVIASERPTRERAQERHLGYREGIASSLLHLQHFAAVETRLQLNNEKTIQMERHRENPGSQDQRRRCKEDPCLKTA